MQKLIWILWPSFVVAGIAETIFFTLFDPQDLQLFGLPNGLSRVAFYSVGFLFFWLVTAASSTFTCFIQKSASEINRCPLPGPARPDGCPKQEPAGK